MVVSLLVNVLDAERRDDTVICAIETFGRGFVPSLGESGRIQRKIRGK
jgi:hypothetical protein